VGAGRDCKIVFDEFHIAKHLSHAVDLLPRKEHKLLQVAGDDRLGGARYDRRCHPAKMEPAGLRQSSSCQKVG
jgi:hypothetical protein